jgi:hypothetical protein
MEKQGDQQAYSPGSSLLAESLLNLLNSHTLQLSRLLVTRSRLTRRLPG